RHRSGFQRLGLVCGVEECREGVAQVEAAAAAVADVEHPLEFLHQRGLVVVLLGLPGNIVPRRGVEAALAIIFWISHRKLEDRQPLALPVLLRFRCPACPGLSGNDWRANARPWPASRTSRRFRRSSRHARSWPCLDTYRCTRAFRRR